MGYDLSDWSAVPGAAVRGQDERARTRRQADGHERVGQRHDGKNGYWLLWPTVTAWSARFIFPLRLSFTRLFSFSHRRRRSTVVFRRGKEIKIKTNYTAEPTGTLPKVMARQNDIPKTFHRKRTNLSITIIVTNTLPRSYTVLFRRWRSVLVGNRLALFTFFHATAIVCKFYFS